MKKEFGIDFRKPNPGKWTDDKDLNNYQVETAGFIPLEVKMKRFEQAGIRAQFRSQDFDSQDYRDMYLNPDIQIYPSDDLEEVQEKLNLQAQIYNDIVQRKKAAKLGETAEGVAGSVQPSQKASNATVSTNDTVPTSGTEKI